MYVYINIHIYIFFTKDKGPDMLIKQMVLKDI